MNRFQATSAEQLTQLRQDSAACFANLAVQELVRLALSDERPEVSGLRTALAEAIETAQIDHPHADVLRELAVEEMERAIETASGRRSNLRGWALDEPPALEETKP
jgi:hypothetical protein